MWVDGAIAIILIVTVVQGYRRGFVYTFIHTVGWLLSVVLGFVWYPHVIKFLKEETGFYEPVHQKIAARIAENTGSAANSAMTDIPEVIRDLLDHAIGTATNAFAQSMSISLSGLIFNIIGFLLIAIVIKLFLLILTLLFSKQRNGGIIGGIDGLTGVFAGALKGLIIVYILLALMVPITSLSGSSFLIGELDGSVMGSYLYDNNLILMVIKGLL